MRLDLLSNYSMNQTL